jgi:hypothetical protein
MSLFVNWSITVITKILTWVVERGQEIGSLVTALAIIAGGGWAIYQQIKKRRAESAEWLHRLFTGFFVDANAKTFRRLLEFDYQGTLSPLLERVLINEEAECNREEQDMLTDLDTALNYLEFILHLEDSKRLDKRDRLAMFRHWYEQLKDPKRAALRMYLRKFDPEALTKEACVGPPVSHERIAFYGTLKEESVQTKVGVKKGDLSRVGSCMLRGKLIAVSKGEYVGLVEEGNEQITADLYDVLNRSVFAALDKYEEFYPDNAQESLYRRKIVYLGDRAGDAWVYISVGEQRA